MTVLTAASSVHADAFGAAVNFEQTVSSSWVDRSIAGASSLPRSSDGVPVLLSLATPPASRVGGRVISRTT